MVRAEVTWKVARAQLYGIEASRLERVRADNEERAQAELTAAKELRGRASKIQHEIRELEAAVTSFLEEADRHEADADTFRETAEQQQEREAKRSRERARAESEAARQSEEARRMEAEEVAWAAKRVERDQRAFDDLVDVIRQGLR